MTDATGSCIHSLMNEIAHLLSNAEAMAHAEAMVKASGTSFFWAMRVLPEAKRKGMYAVYAFCREVDDIADGNEDPGIKRERLDAWRDEVRRLYEGTPAYPIARALQEPLARFGLHMRDFVAVIDGMEMDARETLRISDMDELHLYCDRVACAVGRLSNRVFGIDDARGDRVAAALGRALQLTNILRDVREDADRDRLYLPADRLHAHGIATTNVETVLAHGEVGHVCAEIAALASRCFAEADAALAACDARIMRPAIMMKEVYRRILVRLIERGWRRLDEPVALSKAEKLWVAFRYGMV